MAVVEELCDSGAIIRIHDDCYSNMSEQEVQRILEKIAKDAISALGVLQDGTVCAG